MKIKLEIKAGKRCHRLTVDGRFTPMFPHKSATLGLEVEGQKRVCINGANCFLWVDKIEYVEEKEVTETEEEVING